MGKGLAAPGNQILRKSCKPGNLKKKFTLWGDFKFYKHFIK